MTAFSCTKTEVVSTSKPWLFKKDLKRKEILTFVQIYLNIWGYVLLSLFAKEQWSDPYAFFVVKSTVKLVFYDY